MSKIEIGRIARFRVCHDAKGNQKMKVLTEKSPVCLGSYPGRGEGNRPPEALGTTVHFGWASKPMGRNKIESPVGLESTVLGADPPLNRGRPVSGSLVSWNAITPSGVMGAARGEGSSWNVGTPLCWNSERSTVPVKLVKPSGGKGPHFQSLLKKPKVRRLTQ